MYSKHETLIKIEFETKNASFERVGDDFINIWWLLKEPFFVFLCASLSLCLLLGFLGQKDSLNVWQHTSLRDGDTSK